MLARVLEPEAMDSLDEALAYDAMHHQEVNRRFVEDLLAAGLRAASQQADEPIEVLDLGTGTAQIPIELCQQAPNVRVVATDLAVAMLDVARANIEVESLSDRIMLDRADAKALPYDEGQFACVIHNSLVHHSPEPERVLAETLRVVRPGGLLFVRDLIRPASEEQLVQWVEQYAAEETARQRELLAASLRAALTLDEVRALVKPLGVPALNVQPTSDRHWTLRVAGCKL